MEDREIIDLFWRRSERAIAEVKEKYGQYCRSIAFNILSDSRDAEETVNDTYLGAWNSIPPHRPSVLRTFLGKITRRLSLRKYRDLHRMKRSGSETDLVLDELAECIPSCDNTAEAAELKELGEILNRFVSALPDAERRVFLCRCWYMEPIETIGRKYGFSESKVKSMLSRTRKKLRLCLSKEGIQ